MKIALVDISTVPQSIEHLGLAYIAGFLRRNEIDVSLLHFEIDNLNNIQSICCQIPLSYDLYGFTLFSSTARYVYAVANLLKLKLHNCMIFLGGHLATAASEGIFKDCDSIDFIVLGDGELPILNVVRAIESRQEIAKIPSVVVRGEQNTKIPAISPIRDKEWPVRDYLEKCLQQGYYNAGLLTFRGCVGNCTFCSYNNYRKLAKGNYRNERSIEDVFEEIRFIYHGYGIRSFAFVDGSFEDQGKARIRKLCTLLTEYPVQFHFVCFLRAETFDDKDVSLIQLMGKAGFGYVIIGIEAANTHDLKLYNKRANLADNKRVINLFRDNDIYVSLGFIMLNPKSTLDGVRRNYEFLKEHEIDDYEYYQSYLYLDYGTGLHKYFQNQGYLKPEFSYLYPTNYNFENDEIRILSDFIKNTLWPSSLAKRGEIYRSFQVFFNRLKVLFPEEIKQFSEKYNLLAHKCALVLAEYFRYLYVDFDIKKAQEEFSIFEQKMLDIYSASNTLKYQILLTQPFNDYFLGKRN